MESPLAENQDIDGQPKREMVALGGKESIEGAGGGVPESPEPPFSVYTPQEKKFIVIMASLAALLSPLSANIYYPALNVLAADLNVTSTQINLTITTYLIFQGIAPMFIGASSDETGRRPSYLICFVIYIGACIGLAIQNSYVALLVLRCLQSSGSSATVALANAVVADLVTSAERGSYVGYVSIGALVGPAIGPLIGGLLCQYLGWRSVFWFLTILAGLLLVVFASILPETCRQIVGNGSTPPQKWNITVLSYIKLRNQRRAGVVSAGEHMRTKRPFPNPFNTIRILMDKESGLLLFYSGILFAGFYMVITGMPTQLQDHYGFNTFQVGLCYIPTGCGCLLAAIIVGRFQDWNFRRHAKRLGMVIDKQKQQNLALFPIELARLQITVPLMFVGGVAVIGFGWVMQFQTTLAGPIIFLFVLSFCICGSFNTISTLIVDLNRRSAGTATAAMNLARCLMGAGAVAFVVPMLERIGIGWTSVVITSIWVALSPVVFVIMKYGPRWREEKQSREEEKQMRRDVDRRAAAGSEDGVVEKELESR